MDEPPRWISTTHTYYTGTAFFPDDGYSSPRTSEEYPRSAEEELEQRKLIMAMAQESRGGDSDYLKSQLWWLGISLMILGEVGNFVGKSCNAVTLWSSLFSTAATEKHTGSLQHQQLLRSVQRRWFPTLSWHLWYSRRFFGKEIFSVLYWLCLVLQWSS